MSAQPPGEPKRFLKPEGSLPNQNPPVDPASAPGSPGTNPAKPKPQTAEEQMAQYEEDLKENDWGHQPC